MQALQQRQARQKAVERLRRHPVNPVETKLRRARVRELYGMSYTPLQQFEMVNTYLEENGMEPVSQQTFYADRKVILRDFREAIAKDTQTRAQEHAARLMMLEQRQNEDYEKARANDKNTALLSDNLRKTIMDRAKLDGSLIEKHQHDGHLDILQRIQAVIEVKPQVEPEIVPLLEDGEFALLPNPTRQSDG